MSGTDICSVKSRFLKPVPEHFRTGIHQNIFELVRKTMIIQYRDRMSETLASLLISVDLCPVVKNASSKS